MDPCNTQPFSPEEVPQLFSPSRAESRVLGQGLPGTSLFAELQQTQMESLASAVGFSAESSAKVESDELAHMQLDLNLRDLGSGLVQNSYLTDSHEFGEVTGDFTLNVRINPASIPILCSDSYIFSDRDVRLDL